MILELELAIYQESTFELSSNLEDPLRKTQCSCEPNFKGFHWLQKISLDGLGDLLGLGLEGE